MADLTLTQAVSYFQEAEELSVTSRTQSEKCRDYYNHRQWTAEEEKTLRKRSQPVITRNRIKPKVDYLRGIEIQTRMDPEAVPRTPGDEESAQAATDAVRFVYDQVKFSKIKSEVFENLILEGTGGVEVYAKPAAKEGDFDICIKRYHWDRLGWDPHSREKDFSDALYRYAVVWLDYDKAIARYPGKEGELSGTIAKESTYSTTYDDAPRLKWADASRKRIRIVKMEIEGDNGVEVCEFTRGGFLFGPEPSPYVSVTGKPTWSIILQSSHVDREGNRYGSALPWLDVQDEINARASKYMQLVSTRQTFSNNKAMVGDVQKFKTELAKPNGHLAFEQGEYGKDFGVIPTMDQAAAQFQVLQEAKAEIDSVGVHGALSGAESRDLSGKAISKLQEGASTELKPLFESGAQFDNQVCLAVWDRIKQFWTSEKWIRVTGDEQAPEWIGLNIPITVGQQLMEENGGVLPPEMEGDPRLDIQVGIKNNIAEIDVDFSIVEVPDVVNAMQEQFEALTAIFPAVPDEMKPTAFEMLVEASSLRNKSKFLDKLNGKNKEDDPAAQAAADMQQKVAQLESDMAAAKLDLLKAQAEKTREDAAQSQATKVVKMVEALYSAMQAAQVAVASPAAVAIADSLALSAGYQDQNAPPIIPEVVGDAAQEPTMTPENTSPMFPPNPQGPGEGMMAGIETQRADGIMPQQ
jgi:hypothetical protein